MNSLLIVLLLWFTPQSDEHRFVDSASFSLLPAVKLYLKASVFDSTQHSIRRCVVGPRTDPWEGICLIDGYPVFGTDWEIPHTQLDEAYLVVNKKRIMLDVSSMYDPWIASPAKQFFSAQRTEGGILIKGQFSDGAGSYEVQWLVIEGASIRVKLEGNC